MIRCSRRDERALRSRRRALGLVALVLSAQLTTAVRIDLEWLVPFAGWTSHPTLSPQDPPRPVHPA